LHKSAPNPRTRRSRIGGFSMVELAVSMTILLILSAIAIPSLMHSVRTYQLNSVAARLSDMLKFTRYEAVRRNKAVPFQLQQFGNDWVAWADPDNDGNVDPTEKQVRISGFVTLLPAGGGPPAPTAITNALNVGTLTPTPANPGPLQFDARGAVRVNNTLTANVYVFYVGGAGANPGDFGYRAVILLPSGATQIWTAPAGGPWQRVG
jgi:prepilin-type N-terminal cleavage/methylation domain-containing protein